DRPPAARRPRSRRPRSRCARSRSARAGTRARLVRTGPHGAEGPVPSGRRGALVFAGGDPSPPGVVADVDGGALVVAAGSGAGHPVREGRAIDVLVGDFDSIPPALLADLEAAGVDVRRHPVDKDRTDLALAVDAAVGAGAVELVVVGGHGGRLDHQIANALL